MRNLRYLKLWLALGYIWVGLVVFLSLTPAPPRVLGFPGMDKVGHACAYGFLMFWFGQIFMPGRKYRALGLGFVIMGIILEFTQRATGLRSFEWVDIAADAFGVVMGWALARTPLVGLLLKVEGRLVQNHHIK